MTLVAWKKLISNSASVLLAPPSMALLDSQAAQKKMSSFQRRGEELVTIRHIRCNSHVRRPDRRQSLPQSKPPSRIPQERIFDYLQGFMCMHTMAPVRSLAAMSSKAAQRPAPQRGPAGYTVSRATPTRSSCSRIMSSRAYQQTGSDAKLWSSWVFTLYLMFYTCGRCVDHDTQWFLRG